MERDRVWSSRSVWLVLVAAALVLPVRAQVVSELENAVIGVAERVKPAVVSLTVDRAAETPESGLPIPQPPGGRGFGTARGSGMIYRATDEYYYILTNAHVVRGARGNHVRVQIIAEREEREGTVVAADRRTDTAVVRIDRRETDQLATVTIGSAQSLRAGSFVMAVGSPFGFEWSVSFGVVSGLDRELREPTTDLQPGQTPESYRGLIQTDASINPGNSGGPLVNLSGEVVGINFAIYAPGAAGNVGVGFAIPVDRAVHSAESIIEFGRVRRGYLGVLISDMEKVAQDQGISLQELRGLLGVDAGAYVNSVNADTPAAQAGIEAGDVIVELNGEPVMSSGELVDRVGTILPGREVSVVVVRDGERRELRLTLAELPDNPGEAPAGPGEAPTPNPTEPDALGLRVGPLTADKAAELGVAAEGVLVLEVAPRGVAAGAGITVDSVLLSGKPGTGARVNFDSVLSYQTFVDIVRKENRPFQLRFSAPGADGASRAVRSVILKLEPETE